ncbi:MAG: nuclear transport factor 2 family protein [Rhodospirillaceae bacterium]|nr:nuclear transport factor 2 family protein [Rhodospirillaceae bacterium]
MSSDKAAYLYDVYEISQVLYRYTVAIDSRAYDLFDRCFTPDATIELAGMGVMTRDGYRKIARENLVHFDATQHAIGNPSIQVDGDRAHSRCYFTAQHVKNALAPKPFMIIGGWYDDTFARVGGQENGTWLIKTRLGTALWFDGNPEVLNYPLPPGALPRTPGHEAPAWKI